MILTKIDLLRHGEASGGRYYRGSTDDLLTPAGWLDMRKAVMGLETWDLIVSSPLRRCFNFAERMASDLDIPLQIEPAIKEYHFGEWEGQFADDIEERWPGALDHFYRDPDQFPPPKGEVFTDFKHRVVTAWQQLTAQHQGKHLLIITHAGVIRVLFQELLDLPPSSAYRIKIDHACLSRFQISHLEDQHYVQLIAHGQRQN
ncbi:MAG: histidine phosphatase family protein [Methylomicrobium sp.]|nr:histidine phosphatase family protein [Methylomicrobium sp.]